jgi:L-lactate dehydrogenase complex protein LldG
VSDAARTAILSRLRSASVVDVSSPPATVIEQRPPSLAHLRSMMEAVKTEFLEATPESWPSVVHAFVQSQGIRTLLCGPTMAKQLAFIPGVLPYDRPIEEWKPDLFAAVDASITTTRGAIAATGSLILWPSPEEPRLMSLVPPIHIALLDTTKIYGTFAEVMREERWSAGMPPNALLISGPSKTADIEQTLAYGVHGPKRLVVLLV